MVSYLKAVMRVFGVAAGLGVASVQAVDLRPYISEHDMLAGGAGLVNVLEVLVVDPSGGDNVPIDGEPGEAGVPLEASWVGYFVDIIGPGVTVGAFAVSLLDMDIAITFEQGWNARTFTAVEWDQKGGAELPGPGGRSTSDLGSFQTFFEAGAAGVAYFYADPDFGGTPISEINDQDPDVHQSPGAIQFRLLGGTPFSSSLILDGGGNAIDGSAVPEPSMGMLALAAAGLFLRRRR